MHILKLPYYNEIVKLQITKEEEEYLIHFYTLKINAHLLTC